MKNLVTLNGHLSFTYRGQRVRRVVPDGVEPMDYLYDCMTDIRNGKRDDLRVNRLGLRSELSAADSQRFDTIVALNNDSPRMSYLRAAGIHCALVAQGLKGSTINKYLSVIRRVWGHELPLEKEERPDKPVLSEKDEAVVRANLRGGGNRNALILFDLLLETGLRKSEVMLLSREHMRQDSNGDWLYVHRKKGAGRSAVPISANLAKRLRVMRANDSDHFFLDVNLRRLTSVLKQVNPKFSPHTLRHTYATRALGAGASIYDVSKALGHSSIIVTERNYAHVVPSDAAKRVQEKLNG